MRGSKCVGGIMEFDEGQLGIVPREAWRMWVLVQDEVTFVGGPGGHKSQHAAVSWWGSVPRTGAPGTASSLITEYLRGMEKPVKTPPPGFHYKYAGSHNTTQFPPQETHKRYARQTVSKLH